MAQQSEAVKAYLPKLSSRDLLHVIFEQPHCRMANLVERDVAAQQAAARYLKALVGIGILREVQLGRDKLLVNVEWMKLLANDR